MGQSGQGVVELAVAAALWGWAGVVFAKKVLELRGGMFNRLLLRMGVDPAFEGMITWCKICKSAMCIDHHTKKDGCPRGQQCNFCHEHCPHPGYSNMFMMEIMRVECFLVLFIDTMQ